MNYNYIEDKFSNFTMMQTLEKKNKLSVEDGTLLPLMEDFFSVQGEGFNTGKAAYFIRIGGCDVGCHWCDVKESWDASIHPLTETEKIIERILNSRAKAVVVTGGEPCMYDLSFLTKELKKKNIETFLETSGAYEITGEWDWICLSPKKNMRVLNENFSKANEIKVIVYNNDDFRFAESNAANCQLPTAAFFLQPEWSRREAMLPLIVDYVQKNPQWRISLQTHKYIGIP